MFSETSDLLKQEGTFFLVYTKLFYNELSFEKNLWILGEYYTKNCKTNTKPPTQKLRL